MIRITDPAPGPPDPGKMELGYFLWGMAVGLMMNAAGRRDGAEPPKRSHYVVFALAVTGSLATAFVLYRSALGA